MTLLLDGAPSSFVDLDDPTNVVFEYMEVFLSILSELPDGPLHVTHLGSAASTMARAVEALRPNSRQIGVDIDQGLLDFARTWFDLPKSPRLRLRAGDARAQLELIQDHSQDIIIRDVFADAVTPQHLTTTEFTQLVLRKLKPGGLYLVNCADKPPLKTARSELASFLHACTEANEQGLKKGNARVFAVSEPGILKGRRFGNLVLGIVNATGEDEDTPQLDEGAPSLSRKLRTLAVPAHILLKDDLATFVGTAPVLHDA